MTAPSFATTRDVWTAQMTNAALAELDAKLRACRTDRDTREWLLKRTAAWIDELEATR